MGASQSQHHLNTSSNSSPAAAAAARGGRSIERSSSTLLLRFLNSPPASASADSSRRNRNGGVPTNISDFSRDPHHVLDNDYDSVMMEITDTNWNTTQKITPTKKSRQQAQQCIRDLPQVTLQQDARKLLLQPQKIHCTNNSQEHGNHHNVDTYKDLTLGKESADEEDQDMDLSCLICFYDYRAGDTLTSLPCGHSYHSKCLEEWFSRRLQCPYCRSEIPSMVVLRRKQYYHYHPSHINRRKHGSYCYDCTISTERRKKNPLLVDQLRLCQLRQNYQYHRRTLLQQLSFAAVVSSPAEESDSGDGRRSSSGKTTGGIIGGGGLSICNDARRLADNDATIQPCNQ